MSETRSCLSRDWIEKIRQTTVGIDMQHRLANGRKSRRIYLDSTASTLQLGVVKDIIEQYTPYYANTHTTVHFNAKLSTHEYEWAHQQCLDFVSADPKTYGCFFVGSGTTGGINRIARTLSKKRPERDIVITSIMEHHSNDLPHRKHFNKVIHVPVVVAEQGMGGLDMNALQKPLEQYANRVNYVAVTGVSNVTGIVNPIHEIAEMAHAYGALILVDAAQMAAHLQIQMSGHENPMRDIDLLAMSGHKIYAPSSPGVVITKKELFSDVEPDEVGGGMVDDVYTEEYLYTGSFPDREEAGTPNILGAIALAASLYTLQSIGMDKISAHETHMINYAMDGLGKIDDVVIYGRHDTDQCQRAGAISINIREMHHALTAAILNDYFNIAVRNACFCAHPYVREMISEDLGEQMEGLTNEELEALADLHRGMVRCSFGVYNTTQDIDALIDALKEIIRNKDDYKANYRQNRCGEYVHETFNFDSTTMFSAAHAVDRWLHH